MKLFSQMLSEMIALAAMRHSNQFDLSDRPYILHPLQVMYYLETDDVELQCIAVGHDLIEDTDTTYQELRDMGFTARVIEGIRCMTKVQGETFDQMMTRILSNPDAIRVKLADLRHNSDIRRLKGLTDKDFKRMQRYHRMHQILTQKLKELV